jgi:amino acid transporter
LAAIVSAMCIAEFRNLWWFSDDFDLRFPFGKMHWDVPVIGDVMAQLYNVLVLFALFGGFEAVIMYRMRGAKLPPGKNREWWATSKQLGRGTLAAVAIITLWSIAFHFQWLVLMDIRVVDDRESAVAEYCDNRGCLQNLWLQRAFVPVVIVAMIASTRNGPEPWPRLTRDVPAAVRATQPACCRPFPLL